MPTQESAQLLALPKRALHLGGVDDWT